MEAANNRKKITLRSNLQILFHTANDGLPAVVYMDVLDADKCPAIALKLF